MGLRSESLTMPLYPLNENKVHLACYLVFMQVTHRNDRSPVTALIHFLIQPFASQPTKLRKLYESGSPRLNPPKPLYKKCNIQERQMEEIWVYDITSKRPTSCNGEKMQKTKLLLLWRVMVVSTMEDHFKFLATIAQRPKEPAVITLIFHSLAPNLPAPDAFPQLANLYNTLSKHPAFSEEDVCFAGDSSGANIALALIMYCLRSDAPPTSYAPESAGTLLLVSSTVDLRHEHPDIEEVDRHDPIESLELVGKTGSAWAGDWGQT